MAAVLHILFGVAFTVAVSISAGALLLSRLKLKTYRDEYVFLGFAVGAPCLGTAVFLMAAAHIAYRGVFLAFGVIVIGAAVFYGRHATGLSPLPPLPRLWTILFAAAFTAFTVYYFTNAMAPEMSPDGSSYHLGLVDHYYRAHGLVRGVNTAYSALPQGTEMLFLFAYTFGKHSAAAMVHYAFLVALTFLIVAWGRRYGYPRAGVAAALLIYASPVAGIDGVSAYNDIAAACTIFALFHLLQLWNVDRSSGWLIPIGLLAGFCFAIKYTVALAIPYALVYVGWRARKIRPIVIVAACASLLVAPWVIRDSIWYGNPVAPFFNAVFPNPNIHVEFERQYLDAMRHFGNLPSVRQIILELTVRGQALGGLIGPIFLLAPIALLALRRRIGRELLIAFGVFFLPYFTNHGTRFTLPSLPFLAIAMTLALVDAPIVLVALAVFHLVLSWPPILRRYAPNAWRVEEVLWRAALRRIPEDVWLSGRSSTYIAARMIERDVPRGEPVFAINGIAEAYTTHDIMVRYQSARAETLGEFLFAGIVAPSAPTHIEDFRFPPQRLAKVRVVETAKSDQLWSISEFRVYNGSAELARDAKWRLRASPDPWEVQYAFDNSPATRWYSWQPMSPGMFVEVNFQVPQTIDRVRLECATDQSAARVKLEGMDDTGRWTTLAARPKESDVMPLLGMRSAATEALKRHGIHYLLALPWDFGANDYRANADQWGFTLIEDQGNMRLYRLDGVK